MTPEERIQAAMTAVANVKVDDLREVDRIIDSDPPEQQAIARGLLEALGALRRRILLVQAKARHDGLMPANDDPKQKI
jgi:hypothetical protein